MSKPIPPPMAKAPSANGERLERLVARWWEQAEIGYPRDGKERAGWAEHLERLAVPPEQGGGNLNNGPATSPATDSRPAKDEDRREPQSTRESLAVEGVPPFLAFLSQQR